MGGSGADLPRPLPRPQEHWTERSKGLLQDFANGTLGRGPGPTPPSSSSFHTQEGEGEDEGDHELIRGGRGSCIHFQVEMCMPNYVHSLRQVNNSTVA